jgi:hypothetical protein
MYDTILTASNSVARKRKERIMRKNILETLTFVGFIFFASVQFLPFVGAIGLGFALFPHWPLLAVGVGLLVFGCFLAGMLWYGRKDLFGSQNKGKERLSIWLVALGVSAIVEGFALFFLNMIVVQPLTDWLNGTFRVEELGFSFFFLLLLGVVIMGISFWFFAQSGKQARTKE